MSNSPAENRCLSVSASGFSILLPQHHGAGAHVRDTARQPQRQPYPARLRDREDIDLGARRAGSMTGPSLLDAAGIDNSPLLMVVIGG